ncbi:MAG TPA: hypothetical protein VND63_07615 [Rhodanobacteraceae bacterium]|nr:hypothetical protein [Rhodanobacteraceae bacterium]
MTAECFRSRRPVRVSLLLAVLLVAPAWAAPPGVRVAPADLAASGVLLAPLVAIREAPQIAGLASVRDPAPLLASAAQLTAARAQAAAAGAEAVAAGAEAARLETLYRHGENAALRDVQTARAQAAAAAARRTAAVAQFAAARAAARAQWGAALTALALRGPQALAGFADGRVALIELALPPDTRVPAPHTISLQPSGTAATSATLLGPAPRTDAVVQGPTWYYRATVNAASAGALRIGARLAATLSVPGATRSGVRVPAAAVIWYAGQPWVYVETAPGTFRRLPLPDSAHGAAGWFVSAGLHPGQRVVVHGGELLLSQELKPPAGAKVSGGGDDD